MWLLERSIFAVLQAMMTKGFEFSAQQQETFALGSDGQIMTYDDKVAIIEVNGVLTEKPDMFAMWFGGGNTTYSDIRSALATAESNSNIDSVTVKFNSPGGTVEGMFSTIAAMQNFSKPINGLITGTCASACYALASQCTTLSSENQANRIGSIGVVQDFRVDDTIVSVTSTEAPNKRPDVTTEAGKQAVRMELDDLHDMFVEAIAEGRNTDVDNINANYGRGGVMTARRALDSGMIDSISSQSYTNHQTAASSDKPTKEEPQMDLETLKAQHPALYAQIVQIGVQAESDRVSALLDLGDAAGDMDLAIKAINDNIELSTATIAKFTAAGLRKNKAQDHVDDNQEINSATDNVDNTNDNADELQEAAQTAKLEKSIFEVCGIAQPKTEA